MRGEDIKIYTDGSCHTQRLIGAWAALILIDNDRTILKGVEYNTTHNRMELLAVIKALKSLNNEDQNSKISILSDSQYVVNLLSRRQKLSTKNFKTNAGNNIQNDDLVKEFYSCVDRTNPAFIKVKAHQKNGDIYNREVDLIVRDLVRKTLLTAAE